MGEDKRDPSRLCFNSYCSALRSPWNKLREGKEKVCLTQSYTNNKKQTNTNTKTQLGKPGKKETPRSLCQPVL